MVPEVGTDMVSESRSGAVGISAAFTQIQYELAMSIGASLDMEEMLKTALNAFLSKLRCTSIGVHLRDLPTPDGKRFGIAYTIPRTRRMEAAYQEAMHLIPNPQDLVHWNAFLHRLPIVERYDGDHYYHIVYLPKTGLVIMVRNQSFSDSELQSLDPLLLKLASACQACLQTHELGEAHQNVMRANRELAQKSQQLKDSQEMLYGAMADMHKAQSELRQLAAKNQAILDAIPDLMFYLDGAGVIMESKLPPDAPLQHVFGLVAAGDNIADALPGSRFEIFDQYREEAVSTGAVQVFELSFEDVGAEPLYLEVRLVVTGADHTLAIFRDITNRKAAEAQVAVLARFTAENPNPVLRIHRDGRVLYGNARSEGLLSAWQASAADATSRWRDLVEQAFAQGETINVEHTVGKQVYIFAIAPVLEADYVNIYGRDITGRYAVEQALADERNLLRTLVDILPDRIYAKDLSSRYVLNNDAHVCALGVDSEDELRGRSDADFYAPELAARFRNDERYVLETGESLINIDEDFVDVDGQHHWFSTSKVPLVDVNGAITGIVGMTRDVTERRESQAALSEAATRNHLLAQAVNAASDGIIITDPTEDDNPILYANPSFSRITGYSVDEVLGKNWRFLQGEETAPEAIEEIADAIREQRSASVTMLNYRKEGQLLWNELKISPVFSPDGELEYFVGLQTDITQRKELDKMRDDFVSTVSHELRTPLTSIMGWTETLLNEHPGVLNDLQKRFLTISYESSQRLNKLIEEILTVSRVQQGTLRLQQQPFFPHHALHAVMTMLKPLAKSKEITISVQDRWPRDIELIGDAGRIEQVLTNLIGNAIKFSPELSAVAVDSRHEQGQWYIEIRDQGIGVPKDEMARLFERFYRASNAAAAQIQGTGLGLYVCKAVVEGHGGLIGLKSEEDQGTTAWFSIPVTASTP